MTARRVRPPDSAEAASVYAGFSHSDPFQILSAEHALLRQDLARLLASPTQSPMGRTPAELLLSFSERLREHLTSEERVLYPACERLFGSTDGPAPVLRGDHRTIRERTDALLEETGLGSPVSRVRLDTLRFEIEDHFGKEEQVLFPLTRALLTGTESGSLARRLRAPPVP